MKTYLINVLIGVDQFINTLLAGMPDETLSARAWRMRNKPYWKYARPFIDGLFFALCGQRHHCLKAFMSEVRHSQSPKKERK